LLYLVSPRADINKIYFRWNYYKPFKITAA
jgi:hypothetical protein